MGNIYIPAPAKLVVAVLARGPELLELGKEKLRSVFGPIDLGSQPFGFTHTDYYQPEMGSGLLKQLLSFEQLIAQDTLAQVKLRTNHLEAGLAEPAPGQGTYRRRVNLDPGYLTDAKLVLATTKNYSHRIYLSDGIYAEATLSYRRQQGSRCAGWEPYPWTYPDYREEHIQGFLLRVREVYLAQRKKNFKFKEVLAKV